MLMLQLSLSKFSLNNYNFDLDVDYSNEIQMIQNKNSKFQNSFRTPQKAHPNKTKLFQNELLPNIIPAKSDSLVENNPFIHKRGSQNIGQKG